MTDNIVKVKKITDTATLPIRATKDSAGADLSADINAPIIIKPHETVKIPTGLSMELPQGLFGAIVARSGLSTKEGLRPANCFGVCDRDYRGNYIVALHNDSNKVRIVSPHQRIAQLIIMPYIPVEYVEANHLSDTERNDRGFGSTDR